MEIIMTIKASIKPTVFFGILFICIAAILQLFRSQITDLGADFTVLFIGNLILFVATRISFWMYNKSLQNNNPQYFLRMVYGGLLSKMGICIAAALIYILIARSTVNKYALFGCFGFYFIYTFIEVRLLMQLSKGKKNA